MKKEIYILTSLLFLAGLSVMLYPTISSWYNKRFQIQAVIDYDHTLSLLSEEYKNMQRLEAEIYNKALTGEGIKDPFVLGSGVALPDNYTSVLDINNGIMGYIIIPRIDVKMPIYHGTSEIVLKKGVGHMEMTAFPIGGNGNHPVLTGHTGLPDATLFTNLVKLELGDQFYISILEELLAYEVDNIVVVVPRDTSQLKPVMDKDYVTLVTCTPYGVNSHRLLIRGTRIPYVEGAENIIIRGDMDRLQKWLPYINIVSLVMIILVSVMKMTIKIRRRRRK